MKGVKASVGIGIVGCGWVTETFHVPALRRVNGVQIVALADVNQARLEQLADRYRVSRRYWCFSQLVEDPSVQVVAVCAPPEHHAEVATAAIEAGKNVLIEKPVTVTLDECDQLIERESQAGREVMVAFNLRWHCLVRRAREIIRRGGIGEVEAIRGVLTHGLQLGSNKPRWRGDRGQGGGMLFDLASHHFDLWRFLLDCEIVEVMALSRSVVSDDDTATVTARLSNGAIASLVVSGLTADISELEVYGRRGRLRLSLYRSDGMEVVSRSQRPAPGPVASAVRRFISLPRTIMSVAGGGDFILSYRNEWQHFIDCLRRDLPVECNLQDGRKALQAVLASIASVNQGRPIKLCG